MLCPIVEDYAPFDVDVTTSDPGNDALDGYGIRVVIGGASKDWYGTAGGVASVGSFGRRGTPCFVFPVNLGPNYPKYIWEAISQCVARAPAFCRFLALVCGWVCARVGVGWGANGLGHGIGQADEIQPSPPFFSVSCGHNPSPSVCAAPTLSRYPLCCVLFVLASEVGHTLVRTGSARCMPRLHHCGMFPLLVHLPAVDNPAMQHLSTTLRRVSCTMAGQPPRQTASRPRIIKAMVYGHLSW